MNQEAIPDAVETNCLDYANHLVSGPKREEYGPVTPFCVGLAMMWSGILGFPVNGRQVYLCLAALKIMRQAINPKYDNLVDLAGYARVGELFEQGR